MVKVKHCCECKNAGLPPHGDLVCAKGHKPKFYAPKTITQAQRGDFGWKRNCDDFEIHPLQELADQAQELGLE